MTPEQRIKRELLCNAYDLHPDIFHFVQLVPELESDSESAPFADSAEKVVADIDSQWEEAMSCDWASIEIIDIEDDFRRGQMASGLAAPAHPDPSLWTGPQTFADADREKSYGGISVAAQLRDGRWVGWTYWQYLGQTASNDCSMFLSWMEHSYELELTDGVFKKKEQA